MLRGLDNLRSVFGFLSLLRSHGPSMAVFGNIFLTDLSLSLYRRDATR